MVKSWKRVPHGIWVIDEWSANYFHWITDCLPRVWEGIRWTPGAPVILPDSYRQISYVEDSLKLAGVKVLFFKSSQNLWIDQLIVTARTATFPNFDVELTLKSRKIFRQNPDKSPFRKVYLSRKRASKRKILNELDLELMLIKRDFELVSGDDLSLEDQIKLMSETKLLVGIHGAALTNMLFLPDGAKVLEFRNESDVNNHCYFNLASALGIPYYYTVNSSNNADSVVADFTIDLDKLGAVLDKIV
ncbi:glycosyltransferase family 61 protein [Algoriphagus hitonicola]|uniref:glycosyltransferase family 61 protein n=1 Tax=Algoriphagus hitonicola TaxID=435880 RepID=UPI003614256A